MLREKIASCNAILHFVGLRYGAEPTTREDGEPRRSYTQLEFDIAVELGIPCYVFVLPPNFPFDRTDEEGRPNRSESAELRSLQDTHRADLLAGEHIYQEPNDHDSIEKDVLALRVEVEALSHELATAREEQKQAQQNVFRTRKIFFRSFVALVVAVGAIGTGLFYSQRQTTTHVGEIGFEIEQVRAVVNAVMSEEFLGAAGDTLGTTLSPAQRFDRAVEREARKRGLDPEVIRDQIDQYTDVVARNRNADPLDRALAYLAAGDHEAALIHAKAAVAVLPSTQPLRLAAAWRCAGSAHALAGQNEAAVHAYRQALQHVDSQLVPDEWLLTGLRLILILTEEGDHEDALKLADEAFGLLNDTGTLTKEPVVTAAMMNAAARIYHDIGDLDNAEQFFELAFRIQSDELPARDPTPMDTLSRLAAVRRDLGNWIQAEEEHRTVLRRHLLGYGDESPHVANVRINLGRDLQAQGRYREAREQLETALSIMRISYRAEHSYVLTTRYHLAMLSADEGRTGDAKRLLTRILSSQTERQGEAHVHTLQTTHALSRVHLDASEIDEAVALLRPAIELATTTFGTGSVLALQLELLLVECLLSQGNETEAFGLLERLYENRSVALAYSQRDRFLVQQLIARMLLMRGSHAEAEAAAQIVLTELDSKLGIDHPIVIEAKLHLAAVYDASGNQLAAERTYDEILDEVLRVTSRAGNTRFLVATQLAGRGDLIAAAKQYREARALFEAELGVVHAWTVRAMAEEGLVRVSAGQVDTGTRMVKHSIELGMVDLGMSSLERRSWRTRLDAALNH